MSKKTFGKVFKIVGIAALTLVGVAAAATLAVTGSITAAGMVIGAGKWIAIGGLLASNIGSSLTAASKAAKAERTAMADNLHAQVQPDAKAVWCFGQTKAPLQVTYAETIGDDRVIQVLSGIAHRIHSFEDLYLDDEEVTFSGSSATGAWSDSLRRHLRYGTEDQTAINVSGATFPSSFRGRGFAYFGLQWLLRGSKLKDSNIPTRITQVVKGCLCYDPRKDSTVGGSGSHRADDQSTWEFTENWALVVLFYLIGWRINGKLVIGRGVDVADIDLASFIAMANVCDQTVDGIPRYHVAGSIYLDGDHARVIGELEATVGGKVMRSGGVYTCWVPHNDLVSVATITEDDILDVSAVQHKPVGSLSDLYNTVGGQFSDPDLLYTFETYPELSESAALTEDGKERYMPFDTPYFTNGARSQRVARGQVRRSRFPETWVLPVSLKYIGVDVFDVITLNCKQTNYTNTLVRVQEKTVSLEAGTIIFSLLIEDAAIYDNSLPLLLGPARALAPGFNAASPIELSGLLAESIVVPGGGGTASDGLRVSWDDPGPLVRQTQIAYRVQGEDDWTGVPQASVDLTSAIILPVEPETTYEVRARHITIFGVPSASWYIATSDSGQGTRYYDYNGGAVVQNAWFNTRTRFWFLTSGWNWTDNYVRADGGVRNAIIHTPTENEDFEYIDGKGGEDRMVGARAHNLGFDTFEGERVTLRLAGEFTPDADGTLWVGISYYRYDGAFIEEQVNNTPIDPSKDYDPDKPQTLNLGRAERTFTSPPGAVTGEVFWVLQQHNSGSWAVTGVSFGRFGPASGDSALDLGDGPAEPGATDGAVIGVNTYDADGVIVQENEIRTADGQFAAYRHWPFTNSDSGWTATGATLVPKATVLEVTTTSTDARLMSPDDLNIDGALNNLVALRVKRTGSGGASLFEFSQLYYKTDSHNFSESYKAQATRKLTAGVPTTLVFDMASLAVGGDDWVNSIIRRLRYDPTVDIGDVLEVDWIAVGRISPAVADVVAGNLADQLGFTDFGATDTDDDDTFGTLSLTDMGLRVGNNISVGLEVISSSTRRGRLLVRFLTSGGATISEFTSVWSTASESEYQTLSLQGLTIPATCTQIRFIHQREDSVSGAVGARRLSCNKGSQLTGWSVLRQDVAEGADVTDYADERVSNAVLALSSDGYLTRTSGGAPVNIGQVSLTGLGFLGAYDATKNTIYYQSTSPSSPTTGDIWVDTSGTPTVVKIRQSSIWVTASTLNTGALADLDDVGTVDIQDEAVTMLGGGSFGTYEIEPSVETEIFFENLVDNPTGRPVIVMATFASIANHCTGDGVITFSAFTRDTMGGADTPIGSITIPDFDSGVVLSNLTFTWRIDGGVVGKYSYGVRIRANVAGTGTVDGNGGAYTSWEPKR